MIWTKGDKLPELTGESIWEFSADGKEVKVSKETEAWEIQPSDISFTVTMKNARINFESLAYLLGKKNANCYFRAIRRAKRKKEQERRKKLKATKNQEG